MAPHLDNHIDPDAIERNIRTDYSNDPLSDDEFSIKASKEAEHLRIMYLNNTTAFSMETVLSDPVGDKLEFLRKAVRSGYFVVLLAVGLDSPEKSIERVSLRVARGGHNVKHDRIRSRYPRVLNNLSQAVGIVSLALIVDNSQDNLEDQSGAYHAFALFAQGECVETANEIPPWWSAVFHPTS